MTFLQAQVLRGIAWNAMGSVGAIALQIAQVIIVANVLAPADFGLMGLVLVVLGLGLAFADMGLSNAIIQRPTVPQVDLPSLYWFNVMIGVGIASVVGLSAWPLAHVYNEPRLVTLILVSSLIFVVTPFGQQPQALLQKRLQFGKITAASLSGSILSTVSTVALVLSGAGVIGIVVGQLAGATVKAALLALFGWSIWRPTWEFNFFRVSSYLAFGGFQTGERFINSLSSRADMIIIGLFLGTVELGYYNFAYQLVIFPLLAINPVLTNVAFPLFARDQHDNSVIQAGFLDAIKLLSIVIFPIMLGMAVTAPWFVPIMFGEQWAPAARILQILAAVGLLKALTNPAGSVFLAKGKVKLTFWWNLAVACLNLVVFAGFARQGVEMVALSYASLSFLYAIVMAGFLTQVVGLSPLKYLRATFGPTVAAAIMGVIVLTLSRFPLVQQLSPIAELSVLICSGACAYVALALLLERAYLRRVWTAARLPSKTIGTFSPPSAEKGVEVE